MRWKSTIDASGDLCQDGEQPLLLDVQTMQAGKVFVTGATGFIGERLVQRLAERGCSVRAFSRQSNPPSPPGFDPRAGGAWQHRNVELVQGDVTDVALLRRSMEGCDRVFHLAAYAKNWAADPQTYFRLNVQGVRDVFAVAKELGVRRVVWTSTCLTLGPTPAGVIGDEAMPRTSNSYFTLYEETKSIAEKESLQMAGEGFPVVVVNPTRVYGPGNLTEGNSVTRLIDDYDHGKLPFLLNRGRNVGNWVLVDDVVEGLWLAMERGRPGERYLLGGENASLLDFLQRVDEVSGKRHFRIPLLTFTPLTFSWLLQKRAEWFGAYPAITPGWVRTFTTDWAQSSAKAERELGYQPTPLVDGLRITYQWLQRVRKEQA
jgi:nucleoside-diphosphate-sugar epimerase